jgi:hypothetical protein
VGKFEFGTTAFTQNVFAHGGGRQPPSTPPRFEAVGPCLLRRRKSSILVEFEVAANGAPLFEGWRGIELNKVGTTLSAAIARITPVSIMGVHRRPMTIPKVLVP